MTLEEAIRHCINEVYLNQMRGCDECAKEHEQLAEWLTELKQRREAGMMIDSETLKARIGELCLNNDDLFSAKAYERIIGVIEAMPTIAAEITAQPKSNDEHTAAYWMQKTIDTMHEAYDRLKDTADFKQAIAEAEAIKQRMGIGEKKKITNADRIRQMTDEELADILSDKCAVCDYRYGRCDSQFCVCMEGIRAWLKQEVSEDADK